MNSPRPSRPLKATAHSRCDECDRTRPRTALATARRRWLDRCEAWSDYVGELYSSDPRWCGRPERRPCRDECEEGTHRCHCCVDDSDLVVETRVGERRLVPFQLVNERAREREITVKLGVFTSSGGRPAPVTATIVGDPSFTLAPCSARTVTIAVEVGHRVTKKEDPRPEGFNVDECLVAYADLSIDGCGVRPVRIAVAVLPLDCGASVVRCGSACC